MLEKVPACVCLVDCALNVRVSYAPTCPAAQCGLGKDIADMCLNILYFNIDVKIEELKIQFQCEMSGDPQPKPTVSSVRSSASKSSIRRLVITEKDPTRAVS